MSMHIACSGFCREQQDLINSGNAKIVQFSGLTDGSEYEPSKKHVRTKEL